MYVYLAIHVSEQLVCKSTWIYMCQSSWYVSLLGYTCVRVVDMYVYLAIHV